MYYQVLIETTEKNKKGNNETYFELDKTDLSEIERRIVQPFLRKEEFQFNGYFLSPSIIKRIIIKETTKTTDELATYEQARVPANVLMIISRQSIINYEKYTKDITKEIFDKVRTSISENTEVKTSAHLNLSKVFIVHGRDDLAKTEVARFIEKFELEAIILHEQANAGKTIIEKIEEHTDVGFGIILYTPCDMGGLANSSEQKPRARQNVVLEHGYLMGKLGRNKVCALVKGEVETPNDISGVVYVSLDDHGAWKMNIAKELLNAGYQIDIKKML